MLRRHANLIGQTIGLYVVICVCAYTYVCCENVLYVSCFLTTPHDFIHLTHSSSMPDTSQPNIPTTITPPNILIYLLPQWNPSPSSSLSSPPSTPTSSKANPSTSNSSKAVRRWSTRNGQIHLKRRGVALCMSMHCAFHLLYYKIGL